MAPTGKSLVAIKHGNKMFLTTARSDRRRMIDAHPFSDDQARPTFRAAAIIGCDFLVRHVAWRKASGHWRHSKPIGDFDIPQRYRIENRDRKSVGKGKRV